MITLDGKPLLLEDADVDLHSWMRRYQDLDDLRISGKTPVSIKSGRHRTRNGQASGVGLPVPNYSADRKLKVNTLYWPTGAARWGHGLYLADENTAASLPSLSKIELKFGDPEDSIKTVQMWLLPPRPISANVTENRLWLIPVVDDRFWWQFFDAGDFEVEKTTTWEAVFQNLASMIGATITVDAFDSAYLHPDPVELTRRYDNCALLLDACSHSIGQRIVYLEDGSVVSQNVTNAETAYGKRKLTPERIQAGGDLLGVVAPKTCVVTFPKWSWGVPWCDGDLWVATITPSSSPVTRTDDTRKIVHSAAYADMTLVAPGGSPTNQSVLTSLALAVSDSFYAWQNRNYDLTFISLQPLIPIGFDDCIEWYFGQQLDDGSYRSHTRVYSQPHNFGVEQQLSQHSNWTVLGHFQIGKLDAALVPQSQSGTGYADVSIWDVTAGSEVDTTFNVRAYDWPEISLASGARVELHWHCEENAWYLLPSLGSASIASIVFTMLTDRTRETDVGGNTFGTASVRIDDKLGTAGGATGSTTQVNFVDRRWFGAVKGCQGVADYISDPQRGNFWLVKECQELTAGFTFVTLEDRVGTGDQDVLVTLTKNIGHANADYPADLWGGQPVEGGEPNECSGYSQWGSVNGDWVLLVNNCSPGCTPVPPPGPAPAENGWLTTGGCSSTGSQTPPRTLEVRYRAGTYPRMVAGAIGFAMLDVDIFNSDDNTTMRYYVHESQELPDEISGSLPNDSCKTDFVVYYGFQQDSPYPHNQAIPASMLPLTILNPRHFGLTGASWAATWSDALQKYVCTDMEKVAVSMSSITSETVNGCTTIISSTRQVGVETCSPAGQVENLISYKTAYADKITDFEADAQCGLVISYERQQVLAFCVPPTSDTALIQLENRKMIDECLTVGCDANGVYGLQAHFTTVCVINPRLPKWENCIPIVRCDDTEPCEPQVPPTPGDSQLPDEPLEPGEESGPQTQEQLPQGPLE